MIAELKNIEMPVEIRLQAAGPIFHIMLPGDQTPLHLYYE